MRWLGVPIEKTPGDLFVYEEIIFKVRPDVIVETGTQHGGSAHYLASMCDLVGNGRVLTIDVIERHGPAHPRLTYLTGSSTDPAIVERVRAEVRPGESVLVILDSDHSREHVAREIAAYASLVTLGSYLIVEDTNVSGHPVLPHFGPGPLEAVREFLARTDEFEVMRKHEKFLLTFNAGGFLRRIQEPATSAMTVSSARGGMIELRPTHVVIRVAALTALLIFVFVAAPEILGDWPYDPKPSSWSSAVSRH